LHGVEDYRRFAGMLARVQTFEPVAGNRHWQGRLRDVEGERIRLELPSRKGTAGKKGAGRKQGSVHGAQSSGIAEAQEVEIALRNIEISQLVPEF